eukprot:Tbor_TRINITY_DN5500_c6_g4::TRINITY_DN5500_c6_g4_i2::g.12854::m.12854
MVDNQPNQTNEIGTEVPNTKHEEEISVSKENKSSIRQHDPKLLTPREVRENDRAVRFGLVVSQLGAAKKEEVFPHGIRQMPKLLSLNEVSEYRFRQKQLKEIEDRMNKWENSWWNPSNWFKFKNKKLRTTHVTQVQTLAEDIPIKNEPISIPEVKLDLRPLTDKEISELAPGVMKNRENLLEMEKGIHESLDSIEHTRLKYLRAAENIKCEDEVMRVGQCYDDAQREKMRESALNCGRFIEQLSNCAKSVARAHTLEVVLN